MNQHSADHRPATGTGRWNITICHPDGTVEDRQVDFAEMVRLAASHTRFTAAPILTSPA